jgi:hypothetical protein
MMNFKGASWLCGWKETWEITVKKLFEFFFV